MSDLGSKPTRPTAPMIHERFAGHPLDHVGRFGEKFVPFAIGVDLRQQPRADR